MQSLVSLNRARFRGANRVPARICGSPDRKRLRRENESSRSPLVKFNSGGIEGTGLSDILKAAGLTHGGFYKHFSSKDQLLTEPIGQVLEKSLASMEGLDGIKGQHREKNRCRSQMEGGFH